MKRITIVADENEERFKLYLSEALESLGLEHSFTKLKDAEEHMSIDYIILNSAFRHKYTELNSTYCFVNMDNNFRDNINIFGNIITYGIGSRNTVTVSSLQENNLGFVYCIQRYLSLGIDNIIEPQEIPVHVEYLNDIHLYALMMAVTIGLIEGLKCEEIEEKFSKKIYI